MRMVGVALTPTDRETAEEFFEFFKTPWEPAVRGRKYTVVLSTGGNVDDFDAELFVVYGSTENVIDRTSGTSVEPADPGEIGWSESKLPIYGRIATFAVDMSALTCEGRPSDYWYRTKSRVVRRIGYDLFGEVRHLLTEGQPAKQALVPTLELHIALLRHVLLESGTSFVEIPPRPDGYDFVCCLTHDVDFFGIRRHKFDRTLAGFVARASIGTVIDVARSRRSITEAVRNWTALLSLPLVFMGLRADIWNPFEDYSRIEKGRRSTFFLVPFKDRPGIAPNGTVIRARAVRYQASEIRDEARKIAADGNELAVHGLDAWCDADAGRSEMNELLSLTGDTTAGVRMHWLYFSAGSPERLEAAGFDYDSTCGYNESIGYKAGTSQVFRLPGTQKLMELPLSIMDSALFYSSRMGLTRPKAAQMCRQIVANARCYGGTLVINWHDRSVAPERLWGRFYQDLLEEVGAGNRAWFATAGEAVDWFRWRRSIRFSKDAESGNVTVATATSSAGPAARVRIQRASGAGEARIEEHRFDGHEAITVKV
jgi:hypothetical protein